MSDAHSAEFGLVGAEDAENVFERCWHCEATLPAVYYQRCPFARGGDAHLQ
jgi:hypothetical protein